MGEKDTNDASAPAGMAGYFYQVDVSIYVALELMLAQKRLEQITLEPANHEDLAADLSDVTAVSAATEATLDGYPLVVQAKLRNGEPWGVNDLETLLTKGKRRASPAKLLTDDPKLRYLLITTAALKGVALDAGTRALGVWPASVSPNLRRHVPASEGRIAVLSGLDEQKLEGLIRELLTVTCRVPRVNLRACLDELRQIALGHMRHGPSLWTRDDLERTLKQHEGYLARVLSG